MKKHTALVRASKLAVVLLALAGCEATVGTNRMTVPANAGQICANHCQGIGMRLTAVAIMADNVGCVCQPAAAAAGVGELSTPAGGMTAIAAQQAAVAMAQQSTQRRPAH